MGNVFYLSQFPYQKITSDYPQRESTPVPGYTAFQLGSGTSAETTSKRHNLELSFWLVITIEGDRTQKKWYRMSLICIHFAIAKQLEYKKRASLILADNKLVYKLFFQQ